MLICQNPHQAKNTILLFVPPRPSLSPSQMIFCQFLSFRRDCKKCVAKILVISHYKCKKSRVVSNDRRNAIVWKAKSKMITFVYQFTILFVVCKWFYSILNSFKKIYYILLLIFLIFILILI